MSSDGVYGPYGSGSAAPSSPLSATQERLSTGPEQPRMRMRQRLARLGASKSATSAVLDPLFKVVRTNHPKADLALLERAYNTAEHYHRGQTRKSGDPYITHPLAVATILAELGMTEPTLVAGLLHDTVEDTSYTMEQLTADFGEEVALLVDGVTKLDKVQYGDSAKAETLRKMVIAMSRDIRVLVIKLADRLHNMRTLTFLRPDKQYRIASETLEIFAPLAHRLGMNAVKWELEDLAFSTMEPKVYDEIVHMVAEQAPQRERQLREVNFRVSQRNKASVMQALVGGAELDVPNALVKGEVGRMIENARADLKARGMKDVEKLPIPEDTFLPEAERRVRTGLVVAELVSKNALQATPDQVKAQVETMAASYERPEDVMRYYFADANRLAEVQAIATENNVADFVLGKAKVTDKKMGFDELMGQQAQQA